MSDSPTNFGEEVFRTAMQASAEPKLVWSLLETSPQVDFKWYGQEEQTKGETNKMATKLTKTEREYIALVEDVESEESLVKMYEGYLAEQKKALETARKAVRDFEGEHVGWRLLKPFTVPEPAKTTFGWSFVGGITDYKITFDNTTSPKLNTERYGTFTK